MSDDALPTVQVNGVVWAQIVVGNTVYVTGQFTSARPAGSPAGTNEVPRSNLLAYDITTGNLITSFNHSLNAQGKALAVSPDGSTLYVVGTFTAVDGAAHYRIAAFNTATGNLNSSFSAGVDGPLFAVAATGSAIYVGGSFTNANGYARTRLAAFSPDGLATTWAPTADAQVNAITMTADKTKVIIGGSFDQLSGASYLGLGAVDASTGATLPWASQSATYPIQDTGVNASILSLQADQTAIYVSGFAYTQGNFEGTAAISPTDGHILWTNDCHGDTYSVFPVGQTLYSVGHSHDCRAIGGFPQVEDPNSLTNIGPASYHRALAQTTYASGGVNGPPLDGYQSFQGIADGTQLDWYPDLTAGSYTGQEQAAWSVSGNASYVTLGGEFPTVNGVAQQGLVRFAVKSIAPNKAGPTPYQTPIGTVVASPGPNGYIVTWPTTWDPDNASLQYALYRNGGTTPVYTTMADTRFWSTPTLSWTDSGAPTNVPPTYKLVVSDASGNTTTASSVNLSYQIFDDSDPSITYSSTGWFPSNARNVGDFGNGLTEAYLAGSTATFKFSGASVSLLTETATDEGTLYVSVDGGTPVLVFTDTAAQLVQQRVFTASNLTNGPHTVVVTSNVGIGAVDGFLVGTTAPAPATVSYQTIDDRDPSITYGSGWSNYTSRNLGDFGNGVTATSIAGSTATFKFSGVSVSLLSETNSDEGSLQVSIDGGSPTAVNTATATRMVQQKIFTASNLTNGPHTLVVTSNVGYTLIDGFIVGTTS